jgi:hypothetical protein
MDGLVYYHRPIQYRQQQKQQLLQSTTTTMIANSGTWEVDGVKRNHCCCS